MKHLLIIILVLLKGIFIFAQDLTIPVKFTTTMKGVPDRYEGTDTFGWRYTIENNIFQKEKDGTVFQYKNVSLGPIFKTDIQNPLQLVLFYREFNTVVLLDNQLNEISRINFSNIPQQPVIAEAASLASQNRLWVYDINTQQLGLYNPAGNEFKTITSPFTDSILHYHSDYNYFYWVDIKNNSYVSNLFGKVSFLGTLPDFDKVQLLSSTSTLFTKDGSLYFYDFRTQAGQRIEIAEKSFSGFHYASQILSIFTINEINQYQIILPE